MARDHGVSERHASAAHWLALVAIMVVAVAARLWRIDTLPPGIYRDEAINGLDALRVTAGDRPIYFEANNGREPLYLYLLAASIRFWGCSPGALRFVSAILGALTVLMSYVLGQQLYGRRVGLTTAALVATAVWTVNLSRIGFRAVALPLCQGAMLALLWSGLRRRSIWLMAAAGFCWGAAFYTYLAARFTLVAVPLLVAYLWWRLPTARWFGGWFCLGLVALVVAAPLGAYVLTHWESTMGRAAQVLVFGRAISGDAPLQALGRNLWGAMLAPFVRGDFIPRHNIPLRPAFGMVMAPVGLLGLGLLVARVKRDPVAGLVLIWCLIMALPTVLAENAPHFLRAVGVLPVLYLWPAVGLDWIAARLDLWRPRLGSLGMVLALSGAGVIDLQAYATHLQSEAAYYNFEAGATVLAAQANRFLGSGWQGKGIQVSPAQPREGGVFALDARLRNNYPAIDYLLATDASVVALDLVQPDSGTPLAAALWPYGDTHSVVARLPQGKVIDVRPGAWERGDLELEPRLMYLWVQVGGVEAPEVPLDAHWANGVALDGYTLRRGENQIELALWWRGERPIERDYTVFCQAIVDGALLGQADGPPALGLVPTSDWDAYDGIVDRRVLSVDNDGVRHPKVHIGLYDLATMERLPLELVSGQPTDETQLVLP